jgi:hypothetical protein
MSLTKLERERGIEGQRRWVRKPNVFDGLSFDAAAASFSACVTCLIQRWILIGALCIVVCCV